MTDAPIAQCDTPGEGGLAADRRPRRKGRTVSHIVPRLARLNQHPRYAAHMSWTFDNGTILMKNALLGGLANNVFVVACANTGKGVIIDAACETEAVLELADGDGCAGDPDDPWPSRPRRLGAGRRSGAGDSVLPAPGG